MPRVFISLMIFLAISVISGCGGQAGISGPECLLPDEVPAQVDLPDGGDLLLYQTATSQLAGSEIKSFTLSLDCRPMNGFNITVDLIGASQADLELIYHIGDYDLNVDYFGSGIGEGSIMFLGSVALPAELIVDVRSKNQEPANFQIKVVPQPPTQD
jgi:hypothetical protein